MGTESTTGIRFIKLLKILIKIGIMFLIMTGLILINRKYMSSVEGCEKRVRVTSLEREVIMGSIILDTKGIGDSMLITPRRSSHCVFERTQRDAS